MDYNNTRGKLPPSRRIKRKVSLLLLTAVISLVIAILISSVDFIQIISNMRSHIRNESEVYKILQRENAVLYVATYLFNVTNAEEFLRGEDSKLRVEEVGPFTYLEVRSNEDMEVDEETQTLRYSPKMRPVFQPHLSVADPRDVNVTMPNIAALAMSSTVSAHGYLAKFGFGLLLSQLKSKPIVSLSAHEFLWGYKEPLVRLGNTVLPGWINFESMGVLDRLYNNNKEYRLEVATGIHNKFKIKTMNGLGGLKVWDYEDPEKRTECNTFTDVFEGIAYPNTMSPGAPLKLFRHVLCRFITWDYQGRVSTATSDALRYTVSKDNFAMNNGTDCLCGRGTCFDGVADMSPCYYDLPLVLSNTHFLYGDPKLLDRIEGINPSEENDDSEILIDTKLGIVLKTSFSVQVNVAVNKVDYNEQMDRFSDMVVPLCYFKLTYPGLDDQSLFYLKLVHVISPYLVLSLQVVLFSVSFLLAAYCIQLLWPDLPYARDRRISLQISKETKLPGNAVPLLGS